MTIKSTRTLEGILEKEREKQRRLAARRKANGGQQITVWIDAEAAEILEKATKKRGERSPLPSRKEFLCGLIHAYGEQLKTKEKGLTPPSEYPNRQGELELPSKPKAKAKKPATKPTTPVPMDSKPISKSDQIIIDLHQKGLSAQKIADSLSDMGIKTARGNDIWAAPTVEYIIKRLKRNGKIK